MAEDDALVRGLVLAVLSGAGYELLAADDGEQAIALYKEHASRIQLAVLDVIMPKRGGRDVYNAIRALSPSLPVIFSSGYSDTALDAGILADDHTKLIEKPYTPAHLLQAVRNSLQHAAAHAT